MLKGTRKATQQLARIRGTTSAASPLLFSNPGHGLSTQVHTDEQSRSNHKGQFEFSFSQYASGAVFGAFTAAYGLSCYKQSGVTKTAEAAAEVRPNSMRKSV